jgi:hypothetical protein
MVRDDNLTRDEAEGLASELRVEPGPNRIVVEEM